MTHELKILPQYYKEIISQRKTFEIRKDDRNFQVGDRLFLREWDGEKYTGRLTRNREITYILRDAEKYGLKEGYCILGIQPVGNNICEIYISEQYAKKGKSDED